MFCVDIIDKARGPYWENIGHLDRTDRAKRQPATQKRPKADILPFPLRASLVNKGLITWLYDSINLERISFTQNYFLFQNWYLLGVDKEFVPRAHNSILILYIKVPTKLRTISRHYCKEVIQVILDFLLPFSIHSKHQQAQQDTHSLRGRGSFTVQCM